MPVRGLYIRVKGNTKHSEPDIQSSKQNQNTLLHCNTSPETILQQGLQSNKITIYDISLKAGEKEAHNDAQNLSFSQELLLHPHYSFQILFHFSPPKLPTKQLIQKIHKILAVCSTTKRQILLKKNVSRWLRNNPIYTCLANYMDNIKQVSTKFHLFFAHNKPVKRWTSYSITFFSFYLFWSIILHVSRLIWRARITMTTWQAVVQVLLHSIHQYKKNFHGFSWVWKTYYSIICKLPFKKIKINTFK